MRHGSEFIPPRLAEAIRPMTPEEMQAAYNRFRQENAEFFSREAARMQAEAQRAEMTRRFGHAGIPPRFQGRTLETFVARNGQLARIKSICTRYAENFAQVRERGNCMLMIGRPGTGKTHIACGILQHVIAQGYTGLFTSISEILRAFRDSYDERTPEREILRRYTEIDLLIVDELGVGTGRDQYRLDTLFDIFNRRYEALAPTILLGNLTPAQLEDYLGERIMRRIREDGAPLLTFDVEPYQAGGAT